MLGISRPQGTLTVDRSAKGGLEIRGEYPCLVGDFQPPKPRRRFVLPWGNSVKSLEKRNQNLMAKKAKIQEKQRRLNALLAEKKNG